MECPYCGAIDTKVIDSRPYSIDNSIKRRRECVVCSKRFTTYEKIEPIPIFVIKKNKIKEVFNKNKILKGLERAVIKRNVNLEVLERFVEEIENTIRKTNHLEIESTELGELVMERLKKLDEIAYIRFASVYKDFSDVKSFIKEIEGMVDCD
ncbi:MAG TPA: transcriptional regulator NrdR [Fusobacteriaceae bacterium]|nr:transcriptional regulator NrdR [Fusobacteriaceae bacterium]